MMNIKHIYILLCLLCLCTFVQAQVTIGSLDAPAKTAILDIKQETPTNPATDNTTATKGGLGMPRVNLVDLESLEPFIDPTDADYNEQKILHTGLTVYNIATLSIDISPGMYYWNGAHWEPIIATSGHFNLQLSPTEIVFPSNVGSVNPSRNLRIDWSPSSIAAKLTLTSILRGGIKGYIPPLTTDVSGYQLLSIVIDAMTQAEIDIDPFYERASQLQVVAGDGVGGYKQENVVLRQINYALIIEGFRDRMELGETYTFTVASNTDWDVAVSDPNGILESYRTAPGGNNTDGEGFSFKIKDDNAKEGSSATFTFTNPDGKFPPQTYTITATRYYPNSFIVPIGKSVEIPIRKAYNVWKQELNQTLTGAVTTELIWQDVSSLITGLTLKNGDQGINSDIRVTTNAGATAGGNAMVAIKVGGVIRWSWHIWVTNYNPNSAEPAPAPSTAFTGSTTNVTGGKIFNYNNGKAATVFMDRNIGAINTTVGDPNYGHFGCLYQWGRKDPFPGVKPGYTHGYDNRTLYNTANAVLTPGTPTGGTGINNVNVSASMNIGHSITNPMTFYLGIPLNDYDWYSAVADVHNDYLWSDQYGEKGIYDPCPDGWRVPQTTGGYSSPWLGLTPTAVTGTGFDWTSIGAGYYSNTFYKMQNGVYETFAANRGEFMTTAVNGAFMYAMYIDNSNVSFGPQPRGKGDSVRCAKEVKKE